MKNKRWPDADKVFVRNNYNLLDIEVIAKKIDRTIDAVRQFASANELTRDFIGAPWSREDLQFLKKNYRKMKPDAIASHLDRTKGSVSGKITILRAADGMLPIADISQIDKGKVFYSGKQAQYRALMLALEIGDSFEYPTTERQTVNNCYPYFQDRVFSTKMIDDNTRRCWRIL